MIKLVEASRRPRALGLVILAIVVAVAGTALAAVDTPPPAGSETVPAGSETELDPKEPGRKGGCCGGCRKAQSAVETDGDTPRRGAGKGRPGEGKGCGMGARRGQQKGAGQHGANQDVMQTVRSLVHDYRHEIDREVEYIENGVITVTRSPSDPEAARALERHVLEMKGLLENGGRIRNWDPLFTELFDHADEITMSIETLDDGVRVVETSDNPEVAKLIQAHARKVSEFVERGPEAVHEETALPDGYRAGD